MNLTFKQIAPLSRTQWGLWTLLDSELANEINDGTLFREPLVTASLRAFRNRVHVIEAWTTLRSTPTSRHRPVSSVLVRRIGLATRRDDLAKIFSSSREIAEPSATTSLSPKAMFFRQDCDATSLCNFRRVGGSPATILVKTNRRAACSTKQSRRGASCHNAA